MRNNKITMGILAGIFAAAFLSGCGSGSVQSAESVVQQAPDGADTGQEETEQRPDEENRSADTDFSVVITEDVQAVIDRGYLVVGCKDDVPGVGLYDAETDTYEGGEIDLAYFIAAKIFGTDYDTAVSEKLVHFRPVVVEEREEILVDGEVDYVIATYSITDERKEIIAFSDSYYTSSVGLMINKSDVGNHSLKEADIRSMADLDGKVVGISKGSTTRADMLSYMQKNGIDASPLFHEYLTYDALSEALTGGAIDVFSVDVTILNGYLTESREILPYRFAKQNYGVGVNQENQGLLDAANAVIRELEYEMIVLF
ncbi:MAG: transporter substrate-binding domain-containing protein [Clostridiales bacterium]|nr:transporter substrate-binding domain-containing protein [Clostridiales bacterium]